MGSIQEVKEALSAKAQTASLDELRSRGRSKVRIIRAEHVAQIERIFASFIEQCFHPTETVSRKIER